ncbi:mechanosensitive ion channel, partial [bacterium]|nr:mechanosensitive ion channel [bacterium]
ILVELGVEIIPILATVGILAAGLSFGVQSLVKDLVTGFFMLLEDAFAVGDLVVINGQMGRIESLTVRVVRLRATDGALYTFPYGSITSLCNQNRDFSAAVMLFRVGLETDLNQVFGILEKITTDLQKDKKTRSLVVGPIEIDGVNEVNDHSLEIRAVLKTKPGQHYKVKWAFNRLLKQYLELNKIPAANPRHISYNYAVEK